MYVASNIMDNMVGSSWGGTWLVIFWINTVGSSYVGHVASNIMDNMVGSS
jgi:hypothetical protein